MTPTDFTTALSRTHLDANLRTVAAARLALVDGLSIYAATKQMQLTYATVFVAVRKLLSAHHLPVCEHCGQVMRAR